MRDVIDARYPNIWDRPEGRVGEKEVRVCSETREESVCVQIVRDGHHSYTVWLSPQDAMSMADDLIRSACLALDGENR